MNSSAKAPADPFIMSTMVEAPAKVNLFLRMDGTREDGYHLLFSAFQTLSLCDEITVRIRPRREDDKDSAGVVIGSNSSALPKDPFKNTAFLAAYRFLEKMACREYTVQIDMIKNIPSQAGLGGGSSDAASVLAAMDTLFPGKVSREDLLKIAVSSPDATASQNAPAASRTAFFLKSEHEANIGSNVTTAIKAAVLRTKDLFINLIPYLVVNLTIPTAYFIVKVKMLQN